MGPEHEPPELIRRLAERRARHRERSRPYRAMIVLVGFTVTLAGLVLLVTPGPALVVIPIGLALLALEFAWAERMLHYAVKRADDAKRRAHRATWTERALTAAATLLAIAAVVTAALLIDIPLLPV
jgi:uncharacterized protein (TIGR02611 family)